MNYDTFDHYLQEQEPDKLGKVQAWRTAIGLQEVDGLHPSTYLLETAKRHIEGELSIDEVRDLLDTYYEANPEVGDDAQRTEEADKVSANITKVLSEATFSFSAAGLAALHGRIFDGVFDFAGTFRKCNITKREWVLRGATVLYVSHLEIKAALDYDLATEEAFRYQTLSQTEMVRHFAKFISGIWQIHPFREGNTRTTAVFAIKYLRAMGFAVENDLFSEYAWYFRNALVRANYRNYANKIVPEIKYLERFFRNVLLGEQNELKNRQLLIADPTNKPPQSDGLVCEENQEAFTEGIKLGTKLSTKLSTKSATQIAILNACVEPIRLVELLQKTGFRDRTKFRNRYLNPLLAEALIEMTIPDKPQSRNQCYRLTPKGQALLQEIKTY